MKKQRLNTIALLLGLAFTAMTSSVAFAQNKDGAAASENKPEFKEPRASVNDIVKVGIRKNAAAKKSQERIDKIASQTSDLLADYKTVVKQIEGLKVYNARLERQIEGQLRRIGNLEKGIAEATVIQRQITPLVLRMLDGLEKFVNLDVPFYIDERLERVEMLRRNVDRSDVSVAEKFRQVLEAYKIENEYARNISSYKGVAEIDGVERDVNFLQIGRVALMYQTTDAEVSGAWDQQARQFVQLDAGDYQSAIQKGLRIARKQASIDIMKIPVPAPEAAQ